MMTKFSIRSLSQLLEINVLHQCLHYLSRIQLSCIIMSANTKEMQSNSLEYIFRLDWKVERVACLIDRRYALSQLDKKELSP
jgi:hypothetical protein